MRGFSEGHPSHIARRGGSMRRAKATFCTMTSPDSDSVDRTVGRNALLHAAPQRIDTIRYAIII
jgi:hypothetical protein